MSNEAKMTLEERIVQTLKNDHLFTLDAEDQRKVETIRAALQENANG